LKLGGVKSAALPTIWCDQEWAEDTVFGTCHLLVW